MSLPRAAVDVGSNSVRLLVVDAAGRRLTRELTITRLGRGVDATGRFDEAALEHTVQTILRYRAIWTAHGVEQAVRIAATAAVRDADDRERFLAEVEAATGLRPEILSGGQEASLAFTGATGAVEVARPTAVVDVGGGSTELIVGDGAGAVAASVSLQLGCVRVTERHLADDPPSAPQLDEARAMVEEQLACADRELAEQGVALTQVGSLVGVAGTATTLAALHQGLETYAETAIHGTRIPAAALRSLTAELASMPASARAALGPMQPGREDVIHGGAVVLAAVLDRYGLDELTVSEADGLDGLVASMG